MNKKLIRLTEGDLHRIVKESVNRILNEYKNSDTRFYNDRLKFYLDSGHNIDTAKSYAHFDAQMKGCDKRSERFLKKVEELENEDE